MVTTQEHITITHSMLEHAEERLQEGDLIQASEKGWGAVAHYLKAVAKQRGWQDGAHAQLFRINRRLANETGDPQAMIRLFGNLNGLHSNFYEEWYTEEDVRTGVQVATEYIERLDDAGVFRNQ